MNDFFDKYKTPIVAFGLGALMAIVLSYLITIPFWLTGGLIGLTTALFTDKAAKIFDEQTANLKKKNEERKAKKADAE